MIVISDRIDSVLPRSLLEKTRVFVSIVREEGLGRTVTMVAYVLQFGLPFIVTLCFRPTCVTM